MTMTADLDILLPSDQSTIIHLEPQNVKDILSFTFDFV